MARRDPKVGTGKKPKGSGRRLYTDENPRDTVRIKFATPTDARKTVAKVKKISKPYARKIQILTVGEQRAKVMGKAKVASIFKKGKMRSEKTRKFNGRTYRVSDLKEGPYKKKLVKGLMSARRDVGTALKKKDKKAERNARKRVHKFKKKLGER